MNKEKSRDIKEVDSTRKENKEAKEQEIKQWAQDFLENGYKKGFKSRNSFYDEIQDKIQSLDKKTSEGFITKESALFTEIFANELIAFVEHIVFDKNSKVDQKRNFFGDLYKNFFAKSPTVLDYLKADKSKMIRVLSKINETYGLEFIDTEGQIVEVFSYGDLDLETLAKNLGQQSTSETMSIIRQLGSASRWAIGNGTWAYDGYERLTNLISGIRDTSSNNLTTFVADFELKRIEDSKYWDNNKRKNNNSTLNITEIREQVIFENAILGQEVALEQGIENFYLSKVAEDYVAVLNKRCLPIGLIAHETKQSSQNMEIKPINPEFLTELESLVSRYRKTKNINYLRKLAVSLESMKQYENTIPPLSSENEKYIAQVIRMGNIWSERDSIEQKINNTVYKENHDAFLDVIKYVDAHMDEIFTEDRASEREEYLKHKRENYEDGMYDIIQWFEFDREKRYTTLLDKDGNFEKGAWDLVDGHPIKTLGKMFTEMKNFQTNNFQVLQSKIELALKNTGWYEQVERQNETLKKFEETNDNLEQIVSNIEFIINKHRNQQEKKSLVPYMMVSQEKYFNLEDQKLSHLVKFLHTPETRSYINRLLNIHVEDLALKEQIHFLNFIGNTDRTGFNKLGKISKKKGFHMQNFLRSFLSTSSNEINAEKLMVIANQHPTELANKLFSKYSEYIDTVDHAEELVARTYIKSRQNPEIISKIKETLLKRGGDLLLSQYEKVEKGIFSEEKFNSFLEQVKADVDLFKNTFKLTLQENPETRIEDFLNLEVNKIPASGLQTPDGLKKVSEIDKMIEGNYPDEKLQEAVKTSFHTAIENSLQTEVFTLEREGKVIASARIDHRDDGSVYFGTFNVDPAYCSAKIGNAFFQATIIPYMKEKIVKADCSIRQPIGAYYIEAGFIGTKLYDYVNEPSLSIETNPTKEYVSKKMSKDEVMLAYISGREGFYSASTQEEVLPKRLEDNQVITRYFFDQRSKKWFTVVEKK